MADGTRFRSGERVPSDGFFVFDGFTDGGKDQLPAPGHRAMTLRQGQTFPPIGGKSCYWRQKR